MKEFDIRITGDGKLDDIIKSLREMVDTLEYEGPNLEQRYQIAPYWEDKTICVELVEKEIV